MAEPYAARWDPRDDFEDEEDLGWIGEEKEGVWIAVHPETALALEPSLWGPVSEFRGGLRDPLIEDWREKSAHEFEAKQTMMAARERAQARLLRRPAEGSADGE